MQQVPPRSAVGERGTQVTHSDVRGKVVVITGATSGIGQTAAETLAGLGTRIAQIARDRERGEAALKRLQERGPEAAHAIFYADLSRISEMKRVASEIAATEPRIDVLINNAGAIFGQRQLTEDGLELTFALNHMAYFVVTLGLLERLEASAPARIVNTASDAHEVADLDLKDLQSKKAYQWTFPVWLRYGGPGFTVYGRSKLFNILFTRELARRLQGTGVTANSWHPGFVATRFGAQAGGLIGFGIGVGKRFARTPEEGAKTLVYLASSPEVANVTGKYFHDQKQVEPSKNAQNDAAAAGLWQESLKLAALQESPLLQSSTAC
jgi:NAD(P)-dependent dehydrogenase (short-subunit alcohol dehydrogenase family)